MAEPFLDINVLLRHLLADHPDQSPRATAFLAPVERGEVRVYAADRDFDRVPGVTRRDPG